MSYGGKTIDDAEQKREQDSEGLRPIDDDFMRCLYKDNVSLAQLGLRIITGKLELVITDCQTQKTRSGSPECDPSAWMLMGRIPPGKI